MREEDILYYQNRNNKRVANKKEWIKILENEEKIENNKALEILFFLYDCKNYTSTGKNIAKYFETEVGAINSYVSHFGKRIIDLLGIEEQENSRGGSLRWNIPFETIPELNKANGFTWKLRNELIEAMVERYDLLPKTTDTIDDKIKQFIEKRPYAEYMQSISNDLQIRNEFVEKFNINRIMNMQIDDFVIGRLNFDEKGKESFCYVLETCMTNLGEMRGAFVSKFGVWYSTKNGKYDFSNKYGETLEEAFLKLKQEICSLLISGNNKDYNEIQENMIAPIFKGKILSTYYPENYLAMFNEDDVNKFLIELNIDYDVNLIDTLEKKKALLKEFKENQKELKDKSDYYFIAFLYDTFRDVVKEKNTVSGAIDYNIEFVDFNYIQRHEVKKKNEYRSRSTDYEKISRNKKDVGNRGEQAVLKYEKNKLISLGKEELAEQVYICENDAIGYDIVSYDEDGKEIHIEVKTNSGNQKYLDFYISDNELSTMLIDDSYYIYYLFNIKGKPKCHIINKQKILERKEEFFQPVIYKVNIDVEKVDELNKNN